MKKLPRLAVMLCFLLLLGGCAQFTLVPGGQETSVNDSLKVSPTISWNMWKDDTVETWTIDGPALERIIFLTGIEDGKPLFKRGAKNDEKMPIFSAGMTALEVMDLVEASLARLEFFDIQKTNLKPVPFDGNDGFSFDISCVAKEGLNYKGFARGVVKENSLYLILYIATALHYYDNYKAEAEQISKSAKFL